MTPRPARTAAWRAPGGTHWRHYSSTTTQSVELFQVEQNPGTRQWHTVVDAPHRHLPQPEFEATYTPIPEEPLLDPRITRLTKLVTTLLTDYEQTAGHPHDGADTVRAALDEVAGIPEEARRRRHAAAAQARRSAAQSWP